MKQTLIHFFAIILIGGLLFAGCKKDDPAPQNSFKYNEKESLLGTVFAENLGEVSAGSYGYYFYFLENTLTVHNPNSVPDGLSGTGDDMLIAIVSSDSTGLKPGVYTYGISQYTFNPSTFGYESRLLINHNIADDIYSGVFLFGGGKIIVAKNGEEYTINLSILTTVNSTITGFYKGKIAIYNYNTGKRSATKNPFAFPNLK